MTVLVTGASGFVGNHVSDIFDNVISMPSSVDIADKEALSHYVSSQSIDSVLHLAAQSFVPVSFEDPEKTFAVNFHGTWNLLAALKQTEFKGTFLFVSSGDMYGYVDEKKLPVIEELPLRPLNPYAVSKVAAEALCYQWSQSKIFKIVMTRSFNHIGPGQDRRFAVSAFASQVAEIALGLREPKIMTGDIDVSRDFTDVRDVVRAYRLLLDAGENGGIYNVCSGREYYLRDLIHRMLALEGLSDVEVMQDPQRMRQSDQRRVYASCEKLSGQTGWQPELNMDRSLQDILDYWKGKLRNG